MRPTEVGGSRTRIYVCDVCGRFRPWCDGCADDLPECCDRCWALAHEPWWMKLLRSLFPFLPKGDHGCSTVRLGVGTMTCAGAKTRTLIDKKRRERNGE